MLPQPGQPELQRRAQELLREQEEAVAELQRLQVPGVQALPERVRPSQAPRP